jgi:hypothetical protein
MKTRNFAQELVEYFGMTTVTIIVARLSLHDISSQEENQTHQRVQMNYGRKRPHYFPENSQIVHEIAAHKSEIFRKVCRSIIEVTAKFAKAQQNSKSFL